MSDRTGFRRIHRSLTRRGWKPFPSGLRTDAGCIFAALRSRKRSTRHFNDMSDLYCMDIATKKYRRLDPVNSRYAESFHTCSSNGRWFVFSSRRRDGICSFPYFSYVDTNGNVSKPFLLPQRNPALYAMLLKSFNVPVLSKKPVPLTWRELTKAATDPESVISVRCDSSVQLDGMSKATRDGNRAFSSP